jgi:hypothetical protein
MELTTNNLIKMVIAVLVIVLIILGLYMGVKSYVIPYFSGIGFNESKFEVDSQDFQNLAQEKNKIAYIQNNGRNEYAIFWQGGGPTEFYIHQGTKIKKDNPTNAINWVYGGNVDDQVGFIGNNQEIFMNDGEDQTLTGAFRLGDGIYQ